MTNITSEQIHDALMKELGGKKIDSSWSVSYDIWRIFEHLAEESGYAKNTFDYKNYIWTINLSYKRYGFATIKTKPQWNSKSSTWMYKDFEVTVFYEHENAWNATTLEEFMIAVDAILAKSNENKERRMQLAHKAYKVIRKTLDVNDNDMYWVVELLYKNYFDIKNSVQKGE